MEPALLKALHFDRSMLLEAFSVADDGLRGVQQARTALCGRHKHTSGSVEGVATPEGVELLHVELLCCWTRLRLKLASTLPPPPPPTAKQTKLSSLKNKVEEQKALLEKREKVQDRTKCRLHAMCMMVWGAVCVIIGTSFLIWISEL